MEHVPDGSVMAKPVAFDKPVIMVVAIRRLPAVFQALGYGSPRSSSMTAIFATILCHHIYFADDGGASLREVTAFAQSDSAGLGQSLGAPEVSGSPIKFGRLSPNCGQIIPRR